jgi:hypothetical protein
MNYVRRSKRDFQLKQGELSTLIESLFLLGLK